MNTRHTERHPPTPTMEERSSVDTHTMSNCCSRVGLSSEERSPTAVVSFTRGFSSWMLSREASARWYVQERSGRGDEEEERNKRRKGRGAKGATRRRRGKKKEEQRTAEHVHRHTHRHTHTHNKTGKHIRFCRSTLPSRRTGQPDRDSLLRDRPRCELQQRTKNREFERESSRV
jgi:hypothetical protein